MTDNNDDKPKLELLQGGLSQPLTEEELKTLQTPPEKFKQGCPVIWVRADVEAMTSQSEIVISSDPFIYKRDKRLVHVIDDNGTLSIEPLQRATLLERLSARANFIKKDGRSKEHNLVRPDDDVVNALMARGSWPNVRELVGIITTPTLRLDGTVLQGESRYDPATRLLYAPNAAFPEVPENPTQADASKAFLELLEIFEDFPHESPAHKSIPIANAMTIICRSAIAGAVPLFTYDANIRGSGKTLQTDVASILATGKVLARTGYPATDEELEKVLGAVALQGSQFVCFDNVTRTLGGGPLDKVLTAIGTVALRILGVSKFPTVTWICTLAVTGNNISYSADTARRSLHCRLLSQDAQPEARTGFKHYPLLPWVKENRPRLVAAMLTVLRAYCAAGRPNVGCEPWGSFEAWAELVASAIVYAGGADPMQARTKLDATPDETHFLTLLRCIDQIHGAQAFTLSGIRDWLFPSDKPKPMDEISKEAREAVEELCSHSRGSITGALGYKFRRYIDRNFNLYDGRTIKVVKRGSHSDTNRWGLVISHASPPDPHPSQVIDSSKE